MTPATAPIFVVGSSRSGTTLLRQILNGHDRVWITRETLYFEDLRPRLGNAASGPLDAGSLARCRQYFAQIGGDRMGRVRVLAQVEREGGALGGSGDAFFEAFCRFSARRKGREIWGEKSPRHVFRIAEMMGAFPDARVICLVRDPRAVVLSYREAWQRKLDPDEPPDEEALRKRRQYDPVLTALNWNGTVRATFEARRRFGAARVFVQRYEQLVGKPEAAVRGLCDWLALDFQESMLAEVRVVASSDRDLVGAPGISSEPVARWRTGLAPEEIAVVQGVTRRYMRALGYEREEADASALRIAAVVAGVPVRAARGLWANRHRAGRALEFGRRRASPLFVRRPIGTADDRPDR